MAKTIFKLMLAVTIVSMVVGRELPHTRNKRDLTCATGGHRLCSISCRGRGYRDGACAWDTETAVYDCTCDTERRGVRCNLGGPNTCHFSCMAMGYSEGSCDSNYDCNCGGGNNRWGNFIQDIADRL